MMERSLRMAAASSSFQAAAPQAIETGLRETLARPNARSEGAEAASRLRGILGHTKSEGAKSDGEPFLPIKSYKSFFSSRSENSIRAKRKDVLRAYLGIKKFWSTGCCCLMIASVVLAGLCVAWRVAAQVHYLSQAAAEVEMPVEALEKSDFFPLGCYPLVAGDASGDGNGEVRDEACRANDAPGAAHCRSGVPFFRFDFGRVVSWRFCAKLCLMKGMDISALVDAKECRCGASERNLQVWQEGVVPERLQFQPLRAAVAPNSSQCRLLAARWGGALPPERTDLGESDLEYIRSLVNSAPVESMERLPLQRSSRSNVPVAGLAGVDWVQVAANSTCFPGRCSTGWPWPIWAEYSNGIPYAYDETVTQPTKVSVRSAMSHLSKMICVQFQEVPLSYSAMYKVVVTVKDPGPCYASIIGYPGLRRQDSVLNLASCSQNMGVILHELGHVLGMSHEQARQDRDNHVVVNWANVDKGYTEQFYRSDKSYIGSREAGYVPYDFDSVMHYKANAALHSLPVQNGQGIHDKRLGQRNDFSPLDVVQLRDMYKCNGLYGKDLCVDQEEEVARNFEVFGEPASCEVLKVLCNDAGYVQTVAYLCAKTCDACVDEANIRAAVSAFNASSGGCVDTDPAVCGFLEDFCPGRVAGMEEYMTRHCRQTCCLPEVCSNCAEKSTKENAETPEGAEVVSMTVTFSSVNFESAKQLEKKLRLHYAASLGATSVKLLQAPSCREGLCSNGKVSVNKVCGCQEIGPCSESCAALRLQWVLLEPKKLTQDFAASGELETIQSVEVDVPLSFANFSALAMKYRGFKYLAAGLFACALLAVVIACVLHRWWTTRFQMAEQGVALTPTAQETKILFHGEDGDRKETRISPEDLQVLIDMTHQDSWLEQNWFLGQRRKVFLLVFCVLLALLCAAFMIYVDMVQAPEELVQESVLPLKDNTVSFQYVGCFPVRRAAGNELYDTGCMQRGDAACLHGLPFYRLQHSDPAGCAEFCLGKGLDISGLVDGAECRCGASAKNGIWDLWNKLGASRPDLVWSAEGAVADSSPLCRTDVSKLVGVGDLWSTLNANRDLYEMDLRYLAGFMRGQKVPPPAVPVAVLAAPPAKGGLPSCAQSCTAGRRWPDKAVPFFFSVGLSEDAAAVFSAASEAISRSTCVSFHQVLSPQGALRVKEGQGCWGSLGWTEGGADLELGWCGSLWAIGAVLHELGHVLGLANEEQRSDRDFFVTGASGASAAALPPQAEAAFRGSAELGPADYDFGSIMHGGSVTSLPLEGNRGVHDPHVGQRNRLSAGDILKLQESYQCGPPAAQIKETMCLQSAYRCPAKLEAPKPGMEAWMAEHCEHTCRQSEQSRSFKFWFEMPGDASKEQRLGPDLAYALAYSLGASNATVEVEHGDELVASAEVDCGCSGTSGRQCRSCASLEAQLRSASKAKVEDWLQRGGFGLLTVTWFEVPGQGFWTWTLENNELQLGITMAGSVLAFFAMMQACWLTWWNANMKLNLEGDSNEDSESEDFKP
ncbi:unnamed protein product [Effrenium voratum]|nr:unnamed protein product [Effrenium voratum]